MRPPRPRLLELLVASLITLLVGLVGLTLLLGRSSGELGHVDEVITRDAAPSMIALEDASLKLGELQALLRDRLRGPLADRVLLGADIDAKRGELGDAIETYFQLPVDPGEARVHGQIDVALEGLDRVTNRIMALEDRSPEITEGLARALEERVTTLDAALLSAASLNAEVLTRASAHLRTLGKWILPSAVVVELVCFGAAAFTLTAAYRVVRTAEASSAERQRLLEQRMVELDAFSGRVAHDLLSPLMTVSLALEAAEPHLTGTGAENRRVHLIVSRALGSLRRVRQTVGDLLEFARAGATPQPEAKAGASQVLAEVIDELRPIADAASIELTIEGSSQRQIHCSPGVLRSVLGNLAQNAIKYIDGGAARTVIARVADVGQDVRFEVEDTGPGIALEHQQSIFDPYVRHSATAGGLGLGLATVKRLVEAHGGQVGVRSELGHGACFWVTLPSVSQPPATPPS